MNKSKVVFDKIDCEKSFYIFSKENIIRLTLYKISKSKKFEWVILALIVLSSIKLVLDTYIFDLPSNDPLVIISDDFDYFFTAAFTIECIIKSIALGLF